MAGSPPVSERARDERMLALADVVRGRRRELGLLQRDLADLAGCSQRFIHTLEHAKPGLRFEKVLDVLGVLGLGLVVGPGHGELTAPDGRGDGAK